jgi:hypothetical protein
MVINIRRQQAKGFALLLTDLVENRRDRATRP